jgi:esterase/lipase
MSFTRAGLLVAAALILALALIAVVPVRTSDLKPERARPDDYPSAVAEVARRQAVDDRVAVPSGRSILLVHGHRTPRAVVLLHGFTNSPLQFAALAGTLYEGGDNVYVPRLPHHAERAGSAASLARLTAVELRDAADNAVDVASGLGDSVIVVGLSAGGTMAAWIAQYRREVRRAVVIAPLLTLARVPALLATPFADITVRFPNYTDASPRNEQELDRELGWSTHGIGQMLRLGVAVDHASADAPSAVRDVRILLNEHDRTIAAAPVMRIARRWATRGALVTVTELPDSLRLPHDVIDPRQPLGRTGVVYPVLVALIGGQPAPRNLAATTPLH